jgi:conjugative relaxase-like TrwC/TraI family protein
MSTSISTPVWHSRRGAVDGGLPAGTAVSLVVERVRKEVGDVTVSISRMSGGSGYRYLMLSVAVGDGDRRAGNALTRYYAESGTPPGRWLGSGLAGLDGGRGVAPGSEVSEVQLFRLLGMACDPVSGQPLGRAQRRAKPGPPERTPSGEAAWPPPRSLGAQRVTTQIAGAEHARTDNGGVGKAVAGFDLTFSVPKSVSALWAVADGALQAQIVKAHHEAIGDALAYAERNIFMTRVGAGGVAQVAVRGVVAAAFDHWDTRANDPHLHTHVMVANRVQAVDDGRWRTLDSRALFPATVALSELHQGLLMDRLSQALGAVWEPRSRRHSTVPRYAVAAVPEELCAEFSQRGAAIEAVKNRLVADFRVEHGREPNATTMLKLRDQAALTDRPLKQAHSLAELTGQWRDRARRIVGPDPAAWARQTTRPTAMRFWTASSVTDRDVQRVAGSALAAVADKRATFTRWNVHAETARQLQAIRFASPDDRLQVTERVSKEVLGGAVLLEPPSLAHTPPQSCRADGSSTFRRIGEAPYTTRAILDAESRLLAAARDTTGPMAGPIGGVVRVRGSERILGTEQAAAVHSIVRSGRVLDVLVGAAGTGKTATLAGLVAAWQTEHGSGSVIGLAPSANAAQVLSEQVGIATENTAKWLTETSRGAARLHRIDQLHTALNRAPARNRAEIRAALDAATVEVEAWRVRRGQLVIIDEASQASTLALERIVGSARAVGAKVLLVGDWAQMSAVQAGGAFAMLVRDRADPPELTQVRRFTHAWERAASVRLRAGDPAVIDDYRAHERLHDGDRDTVIDAAHQAWLRDTRTGLASLLIAADRDTVTLLNARARADLVSSGHVSAAGVPLSDGTTAGVGDRVVSRRNDRLLSTGRGWVKNGDRWTVVGLPGDGSLLVRRYRGAGSVRLPLDYVAEHVELGYATTAHRAQGMTVDTAHVVIGGPRISRETLYAAMTRGRHSNHVYVATDHRTDPDTRHGPAERQTAREVLTSILTRAGADLSAHETIRAAQHTATGWKQLVAEYDTLAAAADRDHWTALLDRVLPPAGGQMLVESEAYGPLVVGLRRAEAFGIDVRDVLPRLVADRELDTADDPAAVLHDRLGRFMNSVDARPRSDRLIAGLHPVAIHVGDPDLRRALDERAQLLQNRARFLAARACTDRADWTRRLGSGPTDPLRRALFLRCLATVAAYRDQWGITTPDPLGPAARQSSARIADRTFAQRAAIIARRVADAGHDWSDPSVKAWPIEPEGPWL